MRRAVWCLWPWLVLPVCPVVAQDLEPRQYANIPQGFNFLAAGYGLSEGSVLVDPSIELENAELEVDGPLLGYARGIALGRMSGKFDAAIGHVCLSGSADYEGERVMRDVCGSTDLRARWSVNFLGAPALPLAEFGGYEQDLIVGASLQVSAPIGQYDPDRLVNIGTNRWALKAEVGASKRWSKWMLEVALAQAFFEDNDEFFGGHQREQDPLVGLQVHVVRNLSSGIWVAFDATHYEGGESTTNGVPSEDRLSNARLGATVSFPINVHQSVRVHLSSGISTRTGSDFDTVAVSWQYRWAEGF